MAVLHWVTIGRVGPAVGDRVSAEAGGLPIYRVLKIQGDRLWVREDLSGRDHVMALSAVRWKLEM